MGLDGRAKVARLFQDEQGDVVLELLVQDELHQDFEMAVNDMSQVGEALNNPEKFKVAEKGSLTGSRSEYGNCLEWNHME